MEGRRVSEGGAFTDAFASLTHRPSISGIVHAHLEIP
jgi:hypothetical protein